MDRSRFKRNKTPERTPEEEKAWLEWLSDEPSVLSAEPPAPAPALPPTPVLETRTAPAAPQIRGDRPRTYRPRDGYSQPAVPPPVASVPPPAPHQPAAPHMTTVPASNVTINIHMPKLQLPKLHTLKQGSFKQRASAVKLPALPYKKLALGVAVIAVAGGIFSGGNGLLKSPGKGNAAISGTQATATNGGKVAKAPSFTPAVPQDKPQLASQKDGVSTFDGTKDSYSYTDTLQGTMMTVSEQPLPTKYGSPDDATAKIAAKLGAKDQITVGDTVAYINTDEKSGNQVVVYWIRDVLVLAQSSFKHTNAAWQGYLSNLQ